MTSSLVALPSGRHLFVEKHDPSTETPNSTPIIFIHGIFGSTNTFRPALSAFPSRTRILYDLVGHAKSPLSQDIPTVESLAQDVDQILDHFGYIEEKVDVVAHSAGTIIAIQYALQHARRIRKLVLLGPTSIPIESETKRLLKARAISMRKFGLEGTVFFIVESGLSDKAKDNQELTAELEKEVLSHDDEGVARIVDAMALFECDDKPSSWDVDTIIIAGVEDVMSTLDDAAKTAEWTQGKVFKLNTGHQFILEDPEGTRELLKSILDV